MEEQKKSKRNKIHTILNIILSIIAVAGISYAYFAADIRNSETTSTIFGDAGEMVINYDGGPNIVVGQMTPSDDPFATKNFTVTGNSSITSTMYYNISIIKESNTFTDYGLAYNLTSTNTNNNGTIIPSSTKNLCYFLTGEGEEVLGNGTFIGPTNGNKVHTYTLKLYFPDEEYQIENQGKSFEFYISINEGEKERSGCQQIPRGTLSDIVFADNGGKQNKTEAPLSEFKTISSSNENKMYKMEDDYGDSYYFRGAKTLVNNSLVFANHQWKIIRINGDGSLRIIYNGTCPGNECAINSTGIETQLESRAFNSNYGDNKSVGYMHSPAYESASTSRLKATTNETDSTIKSYLDSWYRNNILGTNFEDYISDTLFCNDRQLLSEVSDGETGDGYGNIITYYAPYYRIVISEIPTLKCANPNDRFTTKNYNNASVPGNNALIYPIGLITADEVIMSGGNYGNSNSSSHLYTGKTYWTMSPYRYGDGMPYAYLFGTGGSFQDHQAYANWGARPVINIKPNVLIYGTGTATDPYVVIN